ncbi:glycosyltransferase [Microcoleus sp. FACHB-831]|uniref:glycosyltransferase n=1 Tax=Microcoleus sp. FACHB-831 TaxID=2692827 RepID=UPI001687CC6A|nr:glycosyltransferase [Microcoleus sp. FACHB-831]MBD1921808.1 glycosyltransferase [Microcoleus sp. FACHB-831]
MPTISTIIPAYNSEKTIRETIESVINQSFSDLEIIVINDGSQDSTLEIVSCISEPRLKVFSYANAGVSASRNRGFSHATGEYISFLDADDIWTPDKLEAQLKALQENPQAGVAYSWTNWIDESGRFLRPGLHIARTGDVYKNLLVKDFIESGSNPLIRRQALVEVGGFDESLMNTADWDMWLRLAARYNFVAVPSPQILYRVAPSSMSSNVWRIEDESLKIIEKAFASGNESLQPLKREILANRYKYLTFKTLDGIPERRRGLVAARFLGNAVRNDPAMLQNPVILLIALFKIAAVTLLPSKQAEALLRKVKSLSKK